jgi:hypothetical protein
MDKQLLRARLPFIGVTIGAAVLALLLAGYSLANAGAPAGVQLRPPAAAQTGQRGQTVVYGLRVTNTGSTFDIITFTVSGNSWPTDIFIVSGTIIIPNTKVLVGLNSGEGRDVQVQVHIPITATNHDVAVINGQSTVGPNVSASSTLTTSVIFKLYLPVIRR